MPESKPKTTSSNEPQTTPTWDEQFAAFCRVLGVPVPSLEEAREEGPKHFVNSGEIRAGQTLVTFEARNPVQLVTPEYEAQVKAEYRAEHPEMSEEQHEAEWQRVKHYLL